MLDMASTKHIRTRVKPSVIGFSLLLHLLFFLSISYEIKMVPQLKQESEYYYEPAYLYHDQTTSLAREDATLSVVRAKPDNTPQTIKLPEVANHNPFHQDQLYQDITKKLGKSAQLTDWPTTETSQVGSYTQPLHMIGDKLLDDPLKELLGHAITRHLFYPEVAKELYLRGTVTIGLTLHPNGQITGVKLLKTSKERLLDLAALSAVKEASPVNHVNLYLKEPKYLVINILF